MDPMGYVEGLEVWVSDRPEFGGLHILVAEISAGKHKLLEKQTASWWYFYTSLKMNFFPEN